MSVVHLCVAGLITVWLLTANILLGLLLSASAPVAWRVPAVFQIHNWTGYLALSLALLPARPLFIRTPCYRS
jgi:hypothetical protein